MKLPVIAAGLLAAATLALMPATSGVERWSYTQNIGGYNATVTGSYQIVGTGLYVTSFNGTATDTNYSPALGATFRYCNSVTGCGPWISVYLPYGRPVSLDRPQNRSYPASVECQQFRLGGYPSTNVCAVIHP